MNIECSLALNTLSSIYMAVVLFSMKNKRKWEASNRLYRHIVFHILVFLLLDNAYLLLSRSSAMLFWAKLVKSAYFIVNSTIVWLWANYIDLLLFGDGASQKKHRFFYTAVFAFNCILVCVNLFTGVLFQLSGDGTFHAGYAAMWAFTLANYASMLLILLLLVRHRNKLERGVFLPLLFFPLPPLFAEIIQIFYRPCSLICTYAVSALIAYQVSQNSTMRTDELTGLANRRMLEETLETWFRFPKGFLLCGIMIDLDGLKQINDTYGHPSGDRALMAMADILREVRLKKLLSARYGGDEFLLLWPSKDGHELSEVEQKLEEAKARHNSRRPPQESIDFSTGSFCCREGDGLTAVQFLQRMDQKMYESKTRKRQKKYSEPPPSAAK